MRWFNKSERPVADLSGLDAVRTSSVITAERAYDLAAGGDLEGAITLFREEGDGYQRLLEGTTVRLSRDMRALLTLHRGNALVEQARMEARAQDLDAALVDSARAVKILRGIDVGPPQNARVLAWALNLYAAFRLAAHAEREEPVAATNEAERLLAASGPPPPYSEIHLPSVLATRMALLSDLGRVDEVIEVQKQIQRLF